jgi:hypothetical protein
MLTIYQPELNTVGLYIFVPKDTLVQHYTYVCHCPIEIDSLPRSNCTPETCDSELDPR